MALEYKRELTNMDETTVGYVIVETPYAKKFDTRIHFHDGDSPSSSNLTPVSMLDSLISQNEFFNIDEALATLKQKHGPNDFSIHKVTAFDNSVTVDAQTLIQALQEDEAAYAARGLTESEQELFQQTFPDADMSNRLTIPSFELGDNLHASENFQFKLLKDLHVKKDSDPIDSFSNLKRNILSKYGFAQDLALNQFIITQNVRLIDVNELSEEEMATAIDQHVAKVFEEKTKIDPNNLKKAEEEIKKLQSWAKSFKTSDGFSGIKIEFNPTSFEILLETEKAKALLPLGQYLLESEQAQSRLDEIIENTPDITAGLAKSINEQESSIDTRIEWSVTSLGSRNQETKKHSTLLSLLKDVETGLFSNARIKGTTSAQLIAVSKPFKDSASLQENSNATHNQGVYNKLKRRIDPSTSHHLREQLNLNS